MARILLVEDELLIVEDLKYKLTRLGHTVVGFATTGEAAVREAAETRPELVMMDFRLRGEMNGMEAARRMREIQGGCIKFRVRGVLREDRRTNEREDEVGSGIG